MTVERIETSERQTRAGSVLIGCDGVRSFVRSVLYPNEGPPRFHGINLWRGVAIHKPFITGNSIARVGAMHTTIIIYPIRDNVDGDGNQLINWVAEVESSSAVPADWNGKGRLEDFFAKYANWNFDWLDVASLIKHTDPILAYTMVDRDPLTRWTFGRMTLLGDAAHPMFPRGGNGGAQAILDASALARHLSESPDNLPDALTRYEAERLPALGRLRGRVDVVPADVDRIGRAAGPDAQHGQVGGVPAPGLGDLHAPGLLPAEGGQHQLRLGVGVAGQPQRSGQTVGPGPDDNRPGEIDH